MQNALAEPLYERLLRSFPADRPYSRSDWADDSMPAPIRHYLNHLLQHHSRREARRLRRARTDWVDYDHPDVEDAVRSFFAAVEVHTRVPADEWSRTLRTAARRTTKHLVRPVPMLANFVFDDSDDPVPLSQIDWRMRFFRPYSYLPEAVRGFARKRDRDALGAEEVKHVLRRVDQRMTADFGPDRWLRLLEPLFDMAAYATGDRTVPGSMLSTFFEEKNAAGVADRVRAREETEGSTGIDPSTLRSLLDASESGEPADEPAPGGESSVAEFYGTDSTDGDLRDVADSMAEPGADRARSDAEARESAPLWKRFKHGRTTRKTEADASEDRSSQPLWRQFSPSEVASESRAQSAQSGDRESSGSTSSPEPVIVDDDGQLAQLEQEVLGTPNPSHRGVYVRELFQGDVEAYRRVLSRLRTTDSWSRASQIIAGDVFRANKVNIYSDPAVHFTNAVEATFRK